MNPITIVFLGSMHHSNDHETHQLYCRGRALCSLLNCEHPVFNFSLKLCSDEHHSTCIFSISLGCWRWGCWFAGQIHCGLITIFFFLMLLFSHLAQAGHELTVQILKTLSCQCSLVPFLGLWDCTHEPAHWLSISN